MSSAKVNEMIEYRVLTREHVEEAICVLAEGFTYGEPLNVALKTPYEFQLELSRRLSEKALKDEVSAVAIDTKSGKVIGAVVGILVTGEDHLADSEDYTDSQSLSENPDPCLFLRYIPPFIKEVDKIYQSHPKLCKENLDKKCTILKSFKLTVLPDYAGQGIGTELISTRTNLAKQKGVGVITAICTSPASQRLYAKLGHEVIGEIFYSDFEVGGERPFASITLAPSAKVMLKML
ncbi:arylalkylamine N-acetyltransferase-like 2 [Glandiceps talaboti]